MCPPVTCVAGYRQEGLRTHVTLMWLGTRMGAKVQSQEALLGELFAARLTPKGRLLRVGFEMRDQGRLPGEPLAAL